MGESTEMAYSTAVNYVLDKKNKNWNQNDKTSDQQDNFEQEFNNLYHLTEDENKTKIKPLEIKVTVKNVKIMFEIDTGYSGDTIVPIGLVKVDVANINCKLLLYVLPGNSKPILGRDWLDALDIIKNFECTYNRRTFKLEFKPNVTQEFCKPRPVAYALIEKVEAEIDRLIKSDVAEKVESSEWATPMVPIMKSNDQDCHEAFEKAKASLSSDQVLVHYDTRLPIKITVDAGLEGIGAEASHIFPGGNCRPFAFASRSLTPAEQTDHKPLIYIFGDKKGFPVMAANRVQRWSVILAAYDYELSEGVRSFSLETIRSETDKDLVLNSVKKYLLNGWPKSVYDSLLPYKSKEKELTLENGCVMWGYRVCVPLSIREEMLNELHSSHMGVVRMKMLARSYVWWPSMDRQIENKCKKYFCGPTDGKMHIVILDGHSKWLDIRELNNITAETTIDVFRDYFATWGIPKKLVTDNGPTFISKLFEDFMLANGVTHIKCAPYHPASNGAAENAVKTFKAKIKILNRQCSTRKEALAKYLFHYRSSPHCTTGVSPAELQMGRKFRTRWDLLKENVGNRVALKQADQQKFFRGNRKVSFDEEVVMARDYANGNWRKAEVSKQISPITYNVTSNDQREWKRHVNQLRSCNLSMRDNDTLRTPEKCMSPTLLSLRMM
ncbi:uncharacterized protein K02A2.6-like [Phymastichus coffea]|uniref:uncharacterized protein K02A2.6-like n=1 Tax=Phymastichus coffea TaxID=108790 RepID=UPI00273B5E78|nr:uncharacterized protein K02A2.6-like [Phymastichus coffea]